MNDFSCELSKAINEGSLQRLVERYNADPTLNYTVSDKKVIIAPSAFYEREGAQNSIEYIYNHSRGLRRGDCLAIEIAGTGLFDKNLLKFLKFIEGEIGDENGCDWDDGDLLTKSYQEAESLDVEVSLGHAHPVFGTDTHIDRMYGGIPSWIPYSNEEEVLNWVKDDKIAQAMIKSKIYEKHRGDFCEILTRAQMAPLVSYFSWILSPALNQLGIFEVKEGGKVAYHPWVVSE